MFPLAPAGVLFILHLCVAVCNCQLSSTNSSNCPPGFYAEHPINQSREKTCLCVEDLWSLYGIRCSNGETLQLLVGYCITCNRSKETCLVGACPYNLYGQYIIVNASELGDSMCVQFHRKGRLCGECMEGYVPSISRSMHCKKCNVKLTLLKYFFLQVCLPSTVMFVTIVCLNLRFSGSPLNALVLFFQITFYVTYYDSKMHHCINHSSSKTYSTLLKIMLAIYGVFNLDFHYLYKYHHFSQVCVGESWSGIHILMLKYFEAFFPLMFILALCFFIYLYNKKFFILVWIWKLIPQKIVQAVSSTKHTSSRSSSMHLINAFVAFLILAYCKILFVSLNIIMPNRMYEIKGTTNGVFTLIQQSSTLEEGIFPTPYWPY